MTITNVVEIILLFKLNRGKGTEKKEYAIKIG